MNFWVARDQDGTLIMSFDKLVRGNRMWDFENKHHDSFMEIPNTLFPEITWESEPVEYTLTKRRTVNE